MGRYNNFTGTSFDAISGLQSSSLSLLLLLADNDQPNEGGNEGGNKQRQIKSHSWKMKENSENLNS